MVCFPKEGDSFSSTKKKLIDQGLGNLVISRFDAVSYIVSRIEFQQNSPFEGETLKKLRGCFEKLLESLFIYGVMILLKRLVDVLGSYC